MSRYKATDLKLSQADFEEFLERSGIKETDNSKCLQALIEDLSSETKIDVMRRSIKQLCFAVWSMAKREGFEEGSASANNIKVHVVKCLEDLLNEKCSDNED